jgi:hypothetical protein
MKWLFACMLMLLVATSAMAGEDPYIAVVGNDILATSFYLSPKYEQFLLDQTVVGAPVDGERFFTNAAIIQPEICDTLGTTGGPLNEPPFTFRGNFNARVTAGNAGWYDWIIALPKKPSGEINLCIQCGVIKPNAFKFEGFNSVLTCAAETGELLNGGGICARAQTYPGRNVLNPDALPSVSAWVMPGPHAATAWAGFHLTAFRNPGTYDDIAQPLADGPALQILDHSPGAKILLKSCLQKCIVVKLPVTGQVSADGNVEHDLEAGDIIQVELSIPKANTVDIYCHAESLKIMGIGEDPF